MHRAHVSETVVLEDDTSVEGWPVAKQAASVTEVEVLTTEGSLERLVNNFLIDPHLQGITATTSENRQSPSFAPAAIF